MDFQDRHVIVTGAGRGIGAAVARALHGAGARVVIADLDGEAANSVARDLDTRRSGTAIAHQVDVSTEAGNNDLIDVAEAACGPVDLFFANAGVGIGTDVSTPDSVWDLAFAVNVHAHRWAARRLIPGWLAAGEGYFCSTASAAGLLSQIGSAPYAVTKHAAVAFAEWLSITYGDAGLRVSCLCPQGVNTAMLASDAEDSGFSTAVDVVKAAGAILEPEDVAQVVLEALREERFLILPHPEVHDYVMNKARDPQRWIGAMRRLQSRVLPGS